MVRACLVLGAGGTDEREGREHVPYVLARLPLEDHTVRRNGEEDVVLSNGLMS